MPNFVDVLFRNSLSLQLLHPSEHFENLSVEFPRLVGVAPARSLGTLVVDSEDDTSTPTAGLLHIRVWGGFTIIKSLHALQDQIRARLLGCGNKAKPCEV